MAKVNLQFSYALHPLFSTPIFSASLPVEELAKVQLEVGSAIEKIRKKENLDSPWKYDNLAGTSFKYGTVEKAKEDNSIKKYKMKLLEQYICRAVDEYCRMLNIDFSNYKLDIFESWINIQTKNNYMNSHIHPTSDISGVYYYKTTPGCGNIMFLTPNQMVEYGAFPFIGGGQTSIEVTPYDGFLLLFPGWLRHQVEFNKTDNERICVPFNSKLINTQN